jgi:hypothetical protein
MKNKDYLLLILAVAFFTLSPSRASAYLDPGSGSMILQLLIAGFLGALFTIKTWWREIKAYFSSIFGKKKN